MSNQGRKPTVLTETTVASAAAAGELLIRAASVLGKLTPQELEALSQATDGKLPECIAWALEGAARVCAQTRESLRLHPPRGWIISAESGLHVGFRGTE